MDVNIIEEIVLAALLSNLNDVTVAHIAAGEGSIRNSVPSLVEVEDPGFFRTLSRAGVVRDGHSWRQEGQDYKKDWE